MAGQPFTWGMGGQQITSPEQAARKRSIAEALIAQSATPGQNWSEGLADVAAALSGTVLGGRVDEAETAGRERAGGLFANLAINSDPNSIIAALTSPDAAWGTDAQTSIASSLLQSGMDRADPMYQLQRQKLEAEIAAMNDPAMANATEYGLTPIWGQMPDGTFGYGVQGKDGSFQQVDTGDLNPLDPRTLAAERGFGTAVGTSQGQGVAAAPSDISNATMALDTLDQIENSPELPYATGMSAGLGANKVPGTGRFGFQNLVDQAKSGAFLSAIQQMRGMGALSNAEGSVATAAITRMDTALSEADFRKALADYRKIIETGLARAQGRVGAQPNANTPTVAPAANATSSGIQWSIEP